MSEPRPFGQLVRINDVYIQYVSRVRMHPLSGKYINKFRTWFLSYLGISTGMGKVWGWRLKSDPHGYAAMEIGALNQKERPYAPPVANSWIHHWFLLARTLLVKARQDCWRLMCLRRRKDYGNVEQIATKRADTRTSRPPGDTCCETACQIQLVARLLRPA